MAGPGQLFNVESTGTTPTNSRNQDNAKISSAHACTVDCIMLLDNNNYYAIMRWSTYVLIVCCDSVGGLITVIIWNLRQSFVKNLL